MGPTVNNHQIATIALDFNIEKKQAKEIACKILRRTLLYHTAHVGDVQTESAHVL
jgi:hypothetical protein